MTRIPLSTYRLQFNRNFTFAQATDIVPYLAALGISHCYASPYVRARPGSMHGYDIIDHHHLNPEIGTPEEYDAFVAALHQHGMGQILDVVPNHMGVMGSDNAWWLDVLENGEASAYADFFDVDWEPLKDELQGKVLVPVLGDQYGTVLDRGELNLTFDPEKGEFSVNYYQHRFPVNPREYPRLLTQTAEHLQHQVPAGDEELLELQSLVAAFGHLPGRFDTAPEKRAERVRDKEIHKKRLAALTSRSHRVTSAIDATLLRMNAAAGDSPSYDALHELIKNQAFRLAHWRVAADDINYRRFFDVNDLAALRQENENVFDQTHEFLLELLHSQKIDGLRIDHPDGLYDPKQYFQRLQCGREAASDCSSRNHYIVAEKILTGDEQLPLDWPIHGTTGYEFSNLVNGVFVDPDAERSMTQIYWSFIGERVDFKQMVYDCKKLVIDRSLNSELSVLANRLSRIALADRHTCDFTVKNLRDALMEIVACFPVYRTYVTERQISESDRKYIHEAVECAKAKVTSPDQSVYDFIRAILLTRQAEGHVAFYQRSVFHFAMRFQQYTSAVMAKGLEDTSFYRYHRLISLNDVGGDPLRFGVPPELFHREIRKRSEQWPDRMLATSTHDSKRSEDVRARINVLSEMPDQWRENVTRWHEINRTHRDPSSGETPSLNDEYLLYQTLIGCWPDASGAEAVDARFKQRMRDYMIKAAREAKEKTSWQNQDQNYESALGAFVENVLSDQEFLDAFSALHKQVSFFGRLNSLSQLLVKLTVPGVPDIYQGNEIWQFALVDPDNRHAVDYDVRRRAFEELQGSSQLPDSELCAFAQSLSGNLEDQRVKLFVTWISLLLRKQVPDLFLKGEYEPLEVEGRLAKHVIAYLRRHEGRALLVVVPRLSSKLLGGEPRLPVGEAVWQDTCISVPERVTQGWRNLMTGEHISSRQGNTHHVRISEVLGKFPVALLVSLHAGSD